MGSVSGNVSLLSLFHVAALKVLQHRWEYNKLKIRQKKKKTVSWRQKLVNSKEWELWRRLTSPALWLHIDDSLIRFILRSVGARGLEVCLTGSCEQAAGRGFYFGGFAAMQWCHASCGSEHTTKGNLCFFTFFLIYNFKVLETEDL